jgi:hypothetical protein
MQQQHTQKVSMNDKVNIDEFEGLESNEVKTLPNVLLFDDRKGNPVSKKRRIVNILSEALRIVNKVEQKSISSL